jgi:succinate dehydrogenase hydrophobic anchor subunit
MGNYLLPPFDGSEHYINGMRRLLIDYVRHSPSLRAGLHIGTFTITVIMVFISVRIWKEFVQVLNRLIF